MNKVEWVFYVKRKGSDAKQIIGTGTFAKPQRSNLYKQTIKLLSTDMNVTSSGYIRKEKFDAENELFSRPTFQGIIERAKKQIYSRYGDIGTCVLGMRLIYKSVPIAEQIVQGNTTNYHYFEEVQKQLIEKLGYVADGFVIEDGHMD